MQRVRATETWVREAATTSCRELLSMRPSPLKGKCGSVTYLTDTGAGS